MDYRGITRNYKNFGLGILALFLGLACSSSPQANLEATIQARVQATVSAQKTSSPTPTNTPGAMNTPTQTPVPRFTPTSTLQFTNVFSYCRDVKTIDEPAADKRWAGPRVPYEVEARMRQIYGREYIDIGTVWRCSGGDVFACNIGSNPDSCDKKPVVSKQTIDNIVAYCNRNPNAGIVPRSVTGNVPYTWDCNQGMIVGGPRGLDADGYVIASWLVVSPR